MADSRTQQATCQYHGAYEASYWQISTEWLGGLCPKCEQERYTNLDRERLEHQAMERREILLRAAGIPRRFAAASLESFRPYNPGAEQVLASCNRYVDVFPAHLQQGSGLVLSGGVGTGKTHLMCAIVRAVIAQYSEPARYVTQGDMVRGVRETYRRSSELTEGDILGRYEQPSLLAIDEVGAGTGSAHEVATLFEIVDRRYQAQVPTILASNLNAHELTLAIGERALDRMRDGGALLLMTWPSYRGGRREACE